MDHNNLEPIVIGDLNSVTSIFIDPVTGMEVAPSEGHADPLQSISEPGSLYSFAIELVEFAHKRAPRGGTGELLAAAKAVSNQEPGADGQLADLFERFASAAITAAWLGVRVGDPSAGTLMAAHALGREPGLAAVGALRNARIMASLHDKRHGGSLSDELEALVDELQGRFTS